MPRRTLSQIDQEQSDNRLRRLMSFADGNLKPAKSTIIRRRMNGKDLEPNLNGLGNRTATVIDGQFQPIEIPIAARVITDARMDALVPDARTGEIRDAVKILSPDLSRIKLAKAADYIGTYQRWNGCIQPEYDMREPFAIADTEVFVKQMVARKKALAARAGYEIMSDRDEDAQYIEGRIEAFEYVTDRTFESVIQDILSIMFLTSNCFLLKIRKEDAAPVKKKDDGKVPVAAYTIIPAHTIQPYLKDGLIVKWRRFFDHGIPFMDYDVDDVIHLKWDVKPGHIFGTPRTIAVRDDIFALRRLEENIELLFINHLFPLFHVKVGSEKAPCTYGPGGESEIDIVKYQIENMPKEGVFVSDERVEIAAVGAEGKSLDFSNLVDHFKTRVYIGLGMSAIDMGEGADATRATADNISQNLKDAIKADLDSIAGQIRMFIFKEWFKEATYSTSVQKGTARTHLSFHELDLDNRIKEETHVMGLYNSHLIDHDEARKRLKKKPMESAQLSKTHYNMHVLDLEKKIISAKTNSQLKINEADVENQKALAGTQMKLLAAQTAHSESTTEHHNSKLEAQAKHMPTIAKAKVAVANASAKRAAVAGRGKPRGGTAKKTTQTAKTVGNKMRPTNQHGSSLKPADSLMFANDLLDSLIAARETLTSEGKSVEKDWREVSGRVFDAAVAKLTEQEITDSSVHSYTRQERDTGLGSLRAAVQETSDPELLSVLIRAGIEDEVDHVELELTLADDTD